MATPASAPFLNSNDHITAPTTWGLAPHKPNTSKVLQIVLPVAVIVGLLLLVLGAWLLHRRRRRHNAPILYAEDLEAERMVQTATGRTVPTSVESSHSDDRAADDVKPVLPDVPPPAYTAAEGTEEGWGLDGTGARTITMTSAITVSSAASSVQTLVTDSGRAVEVTEKELS